MKTTLYIAAITLLLFLSACQSNSKPQPTADPDVKDYYREEERAAQQKFNFTLQTAGTDYKLTRTMATSQTYTTDSVLKSNYSVLDDNALVVIKLTDTTAEVGALAEQLKKLLESAGANKIEISNVPAESTAAVRFTEKKLDFKFKENNLFVYLAIASNGKQKVLFQGSAHNNLESNLAQFKSIAHSIQFTETP